MRILMTGIFLVSTVLSASAFAEEQVAPTSTVEQTEVTKGLYDQVLRVTPRVGVLGYGDANRNYTSRNLLGLTVDIGMSNLMEMPQSWKMGLEGGFLYSHTGSPGSNFFGSNADVSTTAGSNSFLVPVHLAVGYKPTDKTLVALNLGTSLLYRSIGSSMAIGRSGDTDNGSVFEALPSVGLNFGWEASRNIGFSVRGDYIPVPAQDLFTATVGATIGLT